MRAGISLIIILGLSACGSNEKAHASDGDSGGLTSTPISFADATGENSVMMEVGPCPFISDQMIKASVQTSFEITRREVSNTGCRWAYNAGFVIEVTIEDAATAKPVSGRRYNMDIDPVLTKQDGPGVNAAVLNDTAWDKPLPYAYSFEKDGQLVFMHYTGFKTNAQIMRPAAEEIARRMATAPEIEKQRREQIIPFEACTVWTESDVKTVFTAGKESIVMTGARGPSTCSWNILEDGVSGQRTAAFNMYKPQAGKKQEYEYAGYEPFTANGQTHYMRKAPSDFGMYVHIVTPLRDGIVHVTVSDPNGDPTDAAKAFQNNLLSRIVP